MENREESKPKKTAQSEKQDYLWNTLAGLLNASEAVILSMFVTRMTGLEDAGILTMAFAVGNLLMTVGKFGIRNFQVTDVNHRYPFCTYLMARLFTILVMLMALLGYLAYASAFLNYGVEKRYAIFLICLIYAAEALEDVFWGYYQARGHLASGAKLFCARWSAIMIVFPLVLGISTNLIQALTASFLISCVVLLVMLKTTYSKICTEEDRKIGRNIREDKYRRSTGSLLRTALPLFGSSFLSFYLSNAPKYAVDACLPDDVLACYGFVAMPVFVIGLLNNFIYQPVLVDMADEWRTRARGKLMRRILRQLMIILGLTVLCLAGAYILGIPALSILYHTNLSDYKSELMILLCASGFLAVSGYFGVLLTMMRCQKYMLLSYAVVALLSCLELREAVHMYGTMGAAVSYTGLMCILCILYGVELVYQLKSRRESNEIV